MHQEKSQVARVARTVTPRVVASTEVARGGARAACGGHPRGRAPRRPRVRGQTLVAAALAVVAVALAPSTALAEALVAHVDAEGVAQSTLSEGEVPGTTVTYDLNGPVGRALAQETADGRARVLDLVPAFPGYEFAGTWSDRADGSGARYEAGDEARAGSTLYAQWKAVEPEEGAGWGYEVTLDPNGGEGEPRVIAGKGTAETALVSLGEGDVSRDGYELAGWNTERDGSGTAAEGGSIPVGRDSPKVTLYAQWKAQAAGDETGGNSAGTGATAAGADSSGTSGGGVSDAGGSNDAAGGGEGVVSVLASTTGGEGDVVSGIAGGMPQTGVGAGAARLVACGLSILAAAAWGCGEESRAMRGNRNTGRRRHGAGTRRRVGGAGGKAGAAALAGILAAGAAVPVLATTSGGQESPAVEAREAEVSGGGSGTLTVAGQEWRWEDGGLVVGPWGEAGSRRYYDDDTAVLVRDASRQVGDEEVAFGPDGVELAGWDWTVAYDANGGTGEVEAASGRATGEGTDVAAPDGSGLRREGYSFVGWNTAADGSGTAVEAGGTVHVAAGSPSVTLHAQWEELKSGWVEEGGTRHYYDPTTHELARGHVYIDGRFWWLDEQTGDPVTGWHHVDSTGADEYYDQGLMALGWHKTSGRWSGWQYFAKTGKVGERCPLRYSDGSQDMNYVHEVRWKSLPTWSETNYLIVIDTDNYDTVCFQRDGDDWRPIYSWHSVGGDVNRGHTAQGTLWVNGRQADAPGAEWTDRWWVNFNKWTSVSDPEGQAFHYWRYEGRTMNGSGSDGCDMVNWGAAEWIWRNVPDGTGVYSIPGWNTHDYSGVGGQDKYGHTYYHVWSDAERDAAARLYPGEF